MLGPDRTGFNALSEADNTGSFAGKGKQVCWKTFQEADPEIITALADLGTSEKLTNATEAAL